MRAPLQPQRESPAREPPGAATAPHGSRTRSVLALQHTAGNAATVAVLARRKAKKVKPRGVKSWTEKQVKAIQRQLKRLRLYDLTIDGDYGQMTDMGLMEAFGSDEWRDMDGATVIERLKDAERPGSGKGKTLRYAELFKDGVFDMTFGMGYKESPDPDDELTAKGQTAILEGQVIKQLKDRGFKEDAKAALKILKAAGRPVEDPDFGRWFVKENAATYSPPAGTSRKIHAVIRTLRTAKKGQGARALGAFTEAMTSGDAAFYTGHGRYGTGPDFDRNFLQFRVYDKKGDLVHTIDDYEVLEGELKKYGNPWTIFKKWVASGRIEVDFSNAGNLRLVANTPHRGEFGGALIQWALDQQKGGGKVATGKGGYLAKGAKESGRRYRLLAFAGCRTQDYEKSLRATPGFGSDEADVLETTRTVYSGYGAYVFTAFVDSVLGQVSSSKLQQSANQAMREHEPDFSGDPIVITGSHGPRT